MDKNLNIYDGSIIKKFSETAEEIGKHMEDTIESNPEVKAIVKVLKLWFKIYTFLKKADVDHTQLFLFSKTAIKNFFRARIKKNKSTFYLT